MLRDSDAVMKAVGDHLGITPGHTTADGLFTFTEVEWPGRLCQCTDGTDQR